MAFKTMEKQISMIKPRKRSWSEALGKCQFYYPEDAFQESLNNNADTGRPPYYSIHSQIEGTATIVLFEPVFGIGRGILVPIEELRKQLDALEKSWEDETL